MSQDERWRRMGMRQRGILFMGNGSDSSAKAYELTSRFHGAITTLSCSQQPGHPSSDEDAQDDKETHELMIRDLELFVRDLAMAFTGKHIRFDD